MTTFAIGFLGGLFGGGFTIALAGLAVRRAIRRSPLAAMLTPARSSSSSLTDPLSRSSVAGAGLGSREAKP